MIAGSLACVTTPEPNPMHYVSFDEYRMYYQSAERVTDRRLEINRWNYSIAVTTLVAIGLVLVWGTSDPKNTYVGIAGVIMLSIMAFFHCTFWVRQIDDFKVLNTEKFAILNDMAPHVRFPSSGPSDQVRSAEPFRREWRAMAEENALHEIRTTGLRRMLVLKSSYGEYFIPNAFRLLFLLVAIGTLGLGLLKAHQYSPFYEKPSVATSHQSG
jgi:hypothetical protein